MYIDINTLFTFEVSKSDDQNILAAIVLDFFATDCTYLLIFLFFFRLNHNLNFANLSLRKTTQQRAISYKS
jgi:hypothetical protein